MSRLILTGLMATSVFITACQQQKFGSEPTPAAQPKSSSTPPPSTVPPRGPGPGPGVVNTNPPPTVTPPPPRGPGPGPGVIITGPGPGANPPPPPPPGNGNGGTPPPPPPPGYGPGGTVTPPPPGNGPGYTPPPTGNGPGTSVYPTGPGPGPGGSSPGPGNGTSTPPPPPPGNGPGTTVISTPPTTVTTTTPPPTTTTTTTTTTGVPPTTVTSTPQPAPPNLQPAPTVPSSTLPPQQYPQEPQPCVGANCPNQQIVPPPAPVVPVTQKPVAPPPAPAPARPAAPSAPSAPPVQTTTTTPAPTAPAVEPPAAPTPIVTHAPAPECRDQEIKVKTETTKMDLILAMDTSASMRNGKRSGMTGEVGMIAKQIGSFVRGLDTNTDFRIGVILGHGPENAKHPGYKHGTLFQTSSSDPAVIDFTKELKACGKGKNARECAIERVTAALEKKMRVLPTDHSDAQGEAINLSLYDLATTPELRDQMKQQGLLRPGAVLSIIPISDENDVCYSAIDKSTGLYSECKQRADESEDAYKRRCTPAQVKIKDAKGKVIGTGADPKEISFYQEWCARAVDKTRPLTIADVGTALQQNLVGNDLTKLAIMPIVYLDNNTPVHEQDENEWGHGHDDLAYWVGGRPANLSAARGKGESNFAPILADLAKYVKTKMAFNTPFRCGSDMDPYAMDLGALDIHIVDQNGQDLQIFKPQCTQEPCVNPGVASIQLEPSTNSRYVVVKVDENAMSDALQARGFKSGKAQIKFKQRSDYNADGTRKNIFGVSARRQSKAKRAASVHQNQQQHQHADAEQLNNMVPTEL